MVFFFVVKQKTAYEMRISDWSSDVCSSDLIGTYCEENRLHPFIYRQTFGVCPCSRSKPWRSWPYPGKQRRADPVQFRRNIRAFGSDPLLPSPRDQYHSTDCERSEEHTSELQSLMRISYAVFCLKKK